MASKYHKLFLQMIEENRDLFLDFKEVHDKYIDDDSYKDEFNEKGAKVVDVIREYEKRLTSQQDKGQYAKFSSGLADKFWDQVRVFLPRIDFVGVK